METLLYKAQDNSLLLDGFEKKYTLRIRDLPLEEKPREKLIQYGTKYLTANELLAIVLNVGTRKEGVLEISNRTLSPPPGVSTDLPARL